ncbi:hypothetical protein KIN20_016491 [Parelaphostrongylus tenuis]|uniref:Uncharacterized protein n=1 Tax=Parelaphostrongylus tenuis TaxID=148309 RepID=A0AAD5MHG8_PARTN|nr:hypothetical protein KIN20_016491 [Parelaphostrongylus tenuis]
MKRKRPPLGIQHADILSSLTAIKMNRKRPFDIQHVEFHGRRNVTQLRSSGRWVVNASQPRSYPASAWRQSLTKLR